MSDDPRWVRRWNSWISPKPSRPGVWRRRDGGCLVRARVRDPSTGKMREVRMVLPDADVLGAHLTLLEEINRVRSGVPLPTASPPAAPQEPARSAITTPQVATVSAPLARSTLPSFGSFSVSLLERKIAMGEIRSAKNIRTWRDTLEKHLLPHFQHAPVDMPRKAILDWQLEVAKLVKAETYSPHTANNWLTMLGVILRAAWNEHEIERRCPVDGVAKFDTREHATYTEEEPNSLTPAEVPSFLAKLKELWPQHFAMVALGFATGLRPSSMRPLRQHGPKRDLVVEDGLLLVRRSHSIGSTIMETTKTALHQRLQLPEDLLAVLRWHIDSLDGVMAESEFLFPNKRGGMRSPSVLQKPFASVARAIGLRKHVSPRAMRRTFQDLARVSGVPDIVTRKVSGHLTEEMQRRYSTADQREIHDGIARVVATAGLRAAHKPHNTPQEVVSHAPGGMHGGMQAGMQTPEMTSAG